jgi:formate hydrogenlyase subunit 3/multisubunit Na+/H+ antiporter MnhD subunit
LFMRVESQGILVLQSGNWRAPFGITLVADLLAAMLVLATGIVGTAVTAFAFSGVDPRRESSGYHGLLHVLLMGVSGAFLTGDLFNLYVWFEVMLVASFVLMALHRTRAQIEAAFKYVTLNLVASSLFLTALGLLYAQTGTLNMADLASVFGTMVVGLFGALAQKDFRRVLSFNLVGHLGYTTVGLALLTPAAMAASILYVLHHIFVITNLYLISGIFLRIRHSTAFDALGSIYRDRPFVAIVAMVPLFSLAGVPPLSGFIGKLALIESSFGAQAYWTGGIILFVSVLTILSMARLWDQSFWKPAEMQDKLHMTRVIMAPIIGLSLVTLAITFGAETVYSLALRASEQLLYPEAYISAVLQGGGTP